MEFLFKSEMLLVFPDRTIEVSTMNSKPDCPESLYYSGPLSVEDIPKLNNFFADTPESYIVGTIDNTINQVLLNLLAQELKLGRCLEFEDPLNIAQIYILTALNDQQLKIGVFKLHFNSLPRRKKIEYVKRTKLQKYNLLKDYQRHLVQFQHAKHLSQWQESLVECEKTHHESLEYQIRSAHSEHKYIEEQTNSLLCTLCRANQRNVLVLPCAHLIACQSCLDLHSWNHQDTQSTLVKSCFLCHHEIKEIKLIKYS